LGWGWGCEREAVVSKLLWCGGVGYGVEVGVGVGV